MPISHPLLEDDGKAIRDPVWGYIHLPGPLLALVDTEDFQRLRNISQLGFVHLVYPGARHSRFEHSLGVYHLAKQFLLRLLKSDPPLELEDEDVRVFLAATLLHDIGHYPFSHTLEELMPFFVSHEERARRLIEDATGPISRVLRDELGVDPVRVANVIDTGDSQRDIPPRDLLLANILSGTLDPDKIDYLLRDSLFCGVPFGESVNRDRLIKAIKYDPQRRRLAITSKGVSAVESLVFTNYLMYRNVYWHHAVRSATAMFKRSVQDILMHPDRRLQVEDFHRVTEGELLMVLRDEQDRLGLQGARTLLDGVVHRRLHKVATFVHPGERKQGLLHFLYDLYQHPEKRRQKEVEISHRFGEQLGRQATGDEILIDIPRFDKTPEVDLKVFYGADVPSDKPQPLSFDDPEVSHLRDTLVDNFEDQAKIFRVFCVDDDGFLPLAAEQAKRQLH
ncbi:MAG TPA: HD domain-containing protein [Candidatus Latescibacteria bacterium]|jgi:HD superfamily phosphohydrolase|nr:HD domain-containing protein [Candidatus Latescibacterota bacterium]HJP33626.1 HD domain-containing protein [Candidatus Latescibacterota bacterium]